MAIKSLLITVNYYSRTYTKSKQRSIFLKNLENLQMDETDAYDHISVMGIIWGVS